MSSDAGDEVPRETSAAADQQGSGTALKASLAVLGLLFCFGVGLVGETYFREWRGKDAKPTQVTAQLPQAEEPRGAAITTTQPSSPPSAETKLAAASHEAAAAKPAATTALPPHPAATATAGGGASAPSAATNAAATGQAMNSAEPSAATAATLATLAALAPTAAPPAVPAAAPPAPKPATAKTKPAVAAAQTARKPLAGTAAAAPAGAAASRLHYRVQFGAFAIEENAEILRRAIETPKLRISITRAADNSGRVLYHVRSPAFASYDEALNAVREAQDAAKQAQFDEAVEYLIQKVDESSASPTEQARIQAAQSANH